MGFNKAQNEAIMHGKGPCQVLAGPGSGKTLTIVNRIKYLIERYEVRPEEILVVTFTRFAAAEMKSRLCSLMGILRRVSEDCGTEAAEEEDFLHDIAEEIGLVKNNGLKIGQFVSKKCRQDTFRELYEKYEAQRKAVRKLDFDDMLVLCKDLFVSHPDVLKQWQTKFKYILVDEFQDINRVQYDVIRMLALPENNLFVVGDDDQAIYGFRGADSEFMFRFSEDYPQAKRIILNINYRSSGNIVKNSMKVIGHNEKRFLKEFQSVKENGFCVHVQEVKDPNEEAQYVADEIEKRAELGISYEEMAVLFRIHTDARPVAEEFLERKIPFQMKEHLPNIYEHFIGNDLLQVMNRPKRYIGRDSVASGKPSFEEMRKFYCDKEWMLDRIDQFEWDVKMLRKTAPYAGINYIRKRIGYDDFLKDYAFTRKIDRANLNEVLAELEEAARPFATIEEWFRHIEEYTRLLRLKSMKRQEDREGVRLMTLHSAKGLEFDTVFLVEANEGKMPYKKAKTDAETEEERRLFYVGMTRAKEVLKVSYVKTKNGKETSPSRFVDELLE